MTKRREPLTYQHTLTQVAAVIGWDMCGTICGGVTGKSVRNWSDPDCETEIRMIDAERLDRAFIERGGDHAPFHRMFAHRLALAAVRTLDTDLVHAAASAAKESGEAVAALIDAAGSNDSEAHHRALKEGEEALASFTHAIGALRGRKAGA